MCELAKMHRHSMRLPGYDYARAGAYFVTVCTCKRKCLLGEIVGETAELNGRGEIVREEWLRSADMRKEIELDEFVVMPNHLHGIVIIRETNQSVGAHGGAPTTDERDIDKRAYGRTPLRKAHLQPAQRVDSGFDFWAV